MKTEKLKKTIEKLKKRTDETLLTQLRENLPAQNKATENMMNNEIKRTIKSKRKKFLKYYPKES